MAQDTGLVIVQNLKGPLEAVAANLNKAGVAIRSVRGELEETSSQMERSILQATNAVIDVGTHLDGVKESIDAVNESSTTLSRTLNRLTAVAVVIAAGALVTEWLTYFEVFLRDIIQCEQCSPRNLTLTILLTHAVDLTSPPRTDLVDF